VATEYNTAHLIVERENVGWATLQQIIDRGYQNTFYSSTDLKYVDVERQMSNRLYREDQKLVPGFATTLKTRPLIISNLEQYFREKQINAVSKRIFGELDVFIWKNGKAQAAEGYNDDLVMSMGIGLWVRDTALKLRQEGINLTKFSLDKFTVNQSNIPAVYKTNAMNKGEDSWRMKTGRLNPSGNAAEDLKWLL